MAAPTFREETQQELINLPRVALRFTQKIRRLALAPVSADANWMRRNLQEFTYKFARRN
jgi:hypothetical protein